MLVTEDPATLYCMRVDLIERALTGSVIGAFYEVYNALGFGFLEHLYSMALERELRGRGHSVARELRVNVMYKGEILGTQRLDMVVENRLIIEIKSTYELRPSASRQVYNYLRGTNLEVALLLHFGPEPRVHRMVCRNHRGASPPDPAKS